MLALTLRRQRLAACNCVAAPLRLQLFTWRQQDPIGGKLLHDVRAQHQSLDAPPKKGTGFDPVFLPKKGLLRNACTASFSDKGQPRTRPTAAK